MLTTSVRLTPANATVNQMEPKIRSLRRWISHCSAFGISGHSQYSPSGLWSSAMYIMITLTNAAINAAMLTMHEMYFGRDIMHQTNA